MGKKNNEIEIPIFLDDNKKVKTKKTNKKVKSKKRNKTVKFIVLFILFVLIICLLVLSPLFNVYHVEVLNNNKYSEDEIKNIASIPLRY